MEAIRWMRWGEKAATKRTARRSSAGARLPGGTTIVPGLCGRQSQGGDSGRWAGSRGRKQSRSVQIGASREASLLFCEEND